MKWKFVSANQDTFHRFLNLYTLHYEVEKDDGEMAPYSYFVASRNELGALKAASPSFSRPDGVILALYYVDPETGEVSVLLTRQFRPALGAYMTSFPAGLLDPGDRDEIEAARREAREESGVEIDDIELLSPPAPTSSGLSDELDSLVLARIVSFSEKHLEEFEDISCRLCPLSEVRDLLSDHAHYHVPLPARMTLLYILERFSK